MNSSHHVLSREDVSKVIILAQDVLPERVRIRSCFLGNVPVILIRIAPWIWHRKATETRNTCHWL